MKRILMLFFCLSTMMLTAQSSWDREESPTIEFSFEDNELTADVSVEGINLSFEEPNFVQSTTVQPRSSLNNTISYSEDLMQINNFYYVETLTSVNNSNIDNFNLYRVQSR